MKNTIEFIKNTIVFSKFRDFVADLRIWGKGRLQKGEKHIFEQGVLVFEIHSLFSEVYYQAL
jgi:hypothetical protein